MRQDEQELSGIVLERQHSGGQYHSDEDEDEIDIHYYGKITPLSFKIFGHKYYANPQNYMLCFTTLLTSVLSIVLLMYVFQGVHFYIGIFLCLYTLYILLALGFSNPGLGFQDYQKWQFHFDTQQCSQKCNHSETLKLDFGYYCNKCNVPTKRGTRHCEICDVCIYEYDHHCIFLGKCVGGKNMGQFKSFLCMIFSTLIYGILSTIYSINSIEKIRQQ